MTYDHKVSLDLDREWSVYVKHTKGGFTSEDCALCGAKSEDGDHIMLSVEITEMYDENGIDAGRNSRAFKRAKKLLGADGKTRPMCWSCCHPDTP